jgi:hypothetical protein
LFKTAGYAIPPIKPEIMTLQEYLLNTDSGDFTSRRKWQMLVDRFASGLSKPISKAIWPKSLKHLRGFDHDYSFTRSMNGGLSSLRFKDAEIIQSVALLTRALFRRRIVYV